MTVLRMILRIACAATAVVDDIDTIFATYVNPRPGIVEVPNLNADLLDYYLYGHLFYPTTVGIVESHEQVFDIRSKRKLRGDRDLMFRMTNNLATAVRVGLGVRYLLTPS